MPKDGYTGRLRRRELLRVAHVRPRVVLDIRHDLLQVRSIVVHPLLEQIGGRAYLMELTTTYLLENVGVISPQ